MSLKDFGMEEASDEDNALVLMMTCRKDPEDEAIERDCRSRRSESRNNLFFLFELSSFVGMIRTLDLS